MTAGIPLATAIIERGDAPTIKGTDTPVPWWSFTKTVLSAAALRLVDHGKLDLDAPVEERPFTLRQLLRHEAGLPDYGSISRYHEDVAAGKAPWPIPKMLAAVQADQLRFEPGTGWAYSNIGYLMVAQKIEAGSGVPLAATLSSLVFDPGGLQTARLAMSADDLARVEMAGAAGYDPRWVYHGLIAHGLRTPEFLITDGGAGLDRALAALWPDVPAQRCTFHKHRNLLAHAPDALHEEVSADYTDMIYAETAKEVQARRKAFLRKWRLRCAAVALGSHTPD